MEKSSIVHSFLVRALNLQILKNQTRKHAQDRSKLYATLLCVATTSVKQSTPSFSHFAPHHGRSFRPLSPSSSVPRPYDAMTSLYPWSPQPYSRRRERVSWTCWAPCWINQITNLVNWPLQPRIGYKMEPFTRNRRYESSISIRARQYHCSCSSSS
jgi:hypothetical protein